MGLQRVTVLATTAPERAMLHGIDSRSVSYLRKSALICGWVSLYSRPFVALVRVHSRLICF
jgi:hypothetical protein